MSADFLAACEFDPELDLFRPPYRQREALAEIAAESTAGHGTCVSAAIDESGVLVGYAAFQAHDPPEKAAPAAAVRVVELGAIEVAPSQRRRGIARSLLHTTVQGGRYDDAILFARLYAWHFDLGRTGLGPLAYRRFLRRLYSGVGLQVVADQGGEDGAHGADQIMARRGPTASAASVAAFEELLGVRLQES